VDNRSAWDQSGGEADIELGLGIVDTLLKRRGGL